MFLKESSIIEQSDYIYESFLRLAWAGFQPWLKEHFPEECGIIDDTRILMKNMGIADIDQLKEEKIENDTSYKKMIAYFNEYLKHLHDSNGQLSSFWMSYVDMIEILLAFIRASRESNWEMHLSAVRSMLPCFFTYDSLNYSRYMSIYFSDM